MNKRLQLRLVLLCSLMFLQPSCSINSLADRKPASQGQPEQSKRKKNNLGTYEKIQAENADLNMQIKTLSSLNPEVKLDALSRLKGIKIGRYTGLHDKNGDGKNDTLIVYVKPFDEVGDNIKAAGNVKVQLWNLNTEAADALLGQWEITPEELKAMWEGMGIVNCYRLKFDVSKLFSRNKEELTVEVTFIDYITKEVFREQKVIKQ